jgi:hypothetical protein
MLVKQLQQIVTRLNPLTGKPEAPKQEKQYLLLLFYNTSAEEEDKTFELITGRKETFIFLFENLDSIDHIKSHIVSQTVTIESAISTYSFMRLCLEHHMSEEEKDEIEFNEELLNEHMLNFYDLTAEELEELYQSEINQPSGVVSNETV